MSIKCFDLKSNIMAVAYVIKKSTMESLSSFPSSKVLGPFPKQQFLSSWWMWKYSNDTSNKQDQEKKE